MVSIGKNSINLAIEIIFLQNKGLNEIKGVLRDHTFKKEALFSL